MIISNQNIKTMQNYAIGIQIALSSKLKLKTFMKTFLTMLKNDVTHHIMELRGLYQLDW